MARENFGIKKPEPIPTFPEGSGLIIEKILKEYGLAKTQEEGIEKIIQSKDFQERLEIFENLPGTKISRLVKEYAEKKVSLENISTRLEKELNISERKAKQIAEELEKSLFIFIKPIKKEELPPAEVKPEFVPSEEKIIPEEETKPSPRKDTYREPIE